MASDRNASLLRDVLIVIGVFVLAGLLCGWLWHQLWAPAPEGFVYNHVPRFEDDKDFRGPGLYFVIAVSAGLLLSLVVTFLFERDEVATLAAVVVGALAAGGVMAAVGALLGPDSATEFAEHADDWTQVTGDLHTTTLLIFTAFPGGALLGSVIVLTCFNRRRDRPDRSGEPSSGEAVPTADDTGFGPAGTG